MAKAHADLVDEIEAILQDSANALWTPTIVQDELDRATREISEYEPHSVLFTLELETRTGKDTAGTTGSLTDTTESQFVSGDADKVIFNVTNNKWAIVVTLASSSVYGLSRDIMNKDDQYVMYNQECFDPKQLYLGDIVSSVGPDWGVHRVEFPAQGSRRTRRNFEIDGNILTLKYDKSIADSKQENLRSRIVDVNVWVNLMQFVSKHTGSSLVGAVDNDPSGYSRGDTTIHVDNFSSSGTFVTGQEFRVAGLRGLYRLVANATIASGETDITFFPPLENQIDDGDVVTLGQSTLNQSQERKVVDLAAGRAAISMGALLLQQAKDAITQGDFMNATVRTALATLDGVREKGNLVNKGGPNVPGMGAAQSAQELAAGAGYRNASLNYAALSERAREFTVWGERRVATALRDIKSGLRPKQYRQYSRV